MSLKGAIMIAHAAGSRAWSTGRYRLKESALCGQLVIALIVLLIPICAHAQIPQSERDALIAFYNSTDGDHWVCRDHWLEPPGTECSWLGVECNAEGNAVVGINMILAQPLSTPSVYCAPVVFTPGPLPPEIGNLTELRDLQLIYISGELPIELTTLPNLQTLILYGPGLVRIPAELGNLNSLVHLRLSDHFMTGGIPSELGNLSNLRYLNLGNNRLSGSLPPDIGKLKNLESLHLSNNSLTGTIPPEIGDLSSLRELYLSGNYQLSGSLPATIGKLSNLEWLDAGPANLSGSIPPEIGSLSKLTWLRLSNNHLSGSIPPEIGTLNQLQDLYLDHNSLTGTIPPEIGNLSDLRTLDVAGNDLGGRIPSELANLSRLRKLLLRDNRLEGQIPPELGQMSDLQALSLSSNQLRGELPSELMLTQVWDLSLQYNALYTKNTALEAWATERDRYWKSRQTIAPSSIAIADVTSTSVRLQWTPIDYTSSYGFYEVWLDPGSGYVVWASTNNKFADGLTLTGLIPGTSYSFKVRTVTPPGMDNKNTVTSEFSEQVNAITVPHVFIKNCQVVEGDAGTVTASFTIYLTEISPQVVSANWETADGTAAAGSDYAAATGAVHFEPGETEQKIGIEVIGDSVNEPDETFRVYLTGASNANVGNPYGVCTIVDDDTLCGPAPSQLTIDWVGLESGCRPGGVCTPGESIRFQVLETGSYAVQDCDIVTWDFGDGVTEITRVPVTHTYSGSGPYTISLNVKNTEGQLDASAVVEFADPSVPKPVVSITPVSTKAKVGSTIHFAGDFQTGSETPLLAIDWLVIRTTLGEEIIHTASNIGDISYTFNEIGDYRIELTATNAGGVSTPAIALVTVAEFTEYSFLIPVVAHLPGSNGTQWRTDLQIFNTDPLKGPLAFEFEFRGGRVSFKREIIVTSSTKIYEDFLEVIAAPFPPPEDAGPVIVRVRGDSPPLMWTRTYTIDASGVGRYGQLIPIVPLDSVQSSGGEGLVHFLPGLEVSPRFRTNLGLVNLSTRGATAVVMATDESGSEIGEFTVQLPPLLLIQIGDLGNRIELPSGGAPFGLRIHSSGNDPLVVYASMIDQISNDPVLIPGSRDVVGQGKGRKTQIVPGAGHLVQSSGTWRSDVTIYNREVIPIHFDVAYFESAGNMRARAEDQALGPGAFVRVEDILQWEELDQAPGDSFGLIKVITTETVSRYPLVMQRTYKDRGGLGTFGQAMWGISPDEANVKVGTAAFIPGVRSDATYYTNLGLVAVGDEPSFVKVTLLDDVRGTPVGNWQYVVDGVVTGIQPDASLIATNIVRAISPTATKGTLKIEVESGGDVWAYASVIGGADPACGCSKPEQTFDPEYIPAVPMSTP